MPYIFTYFTVSRLPLSLLNFYLLFYYQLAPTHTFIFRFRMVIYYIHAIRYTLELITNTFYLYLNANVYFKSCITLKTNSFKTRLKKDGVN